jgi:hypothetical protein
VIVPYVEHCPPDVTAAIFWLKNRDPQHWRDTQQLEHVMGKYLISDTPMTPEQWARERADVIDGTVIEEQEAANLRTASEIENERLEKKRLLPSRPIDDAASHGLPRNPTGRNK